VSAFKGTANTDYQNYLVAKTKGPNYHILFTAPLQNVLLYIQKVPSSNVGPMADYTELFSRFSSKNVR
jgi:hypothetical protein